MPRVVLATRSGGKLKELAPLLRASGYDPITLVDAGVLHDPAEAGIEVYATFEENAEAKARYYYARAGGLPVIADDSGLEVDALGGEPGVHSKRWAGAVGADVEVDRANNRKLVRLLHGARDRSARFRCVAAWHDGARLWHAGGVVEGTIVDSPRGGEGFGYDPLFWANELAMTFGEATRAMKEPVSHRGRAVRALLELVGRGR